MDTARRDSKFHVGINTGIYVTAHPTGPLLMVYRETEGEEGSKFEPWASFSRNSVRCVGGPFVLRGQGIRKITIIEPHALSVKVHIASSHISDRIATKIISNEPLELFTKIRTHEK